MTTETHTNPWSKLGPSCAKLWTSCHTYYHNAPCSGHLVPPTPPSGRGHLSKLWECWLLSPSPGTALKEAALSKVVPRSGGSPHPGIASPGDLCEGSPATDLSDRLGDACVGLHCCLTARCSPSFIPGPHPSVSGSAVSEPLFTVCAFPRHSERFEGTGCVWLVYCRITRSRHIINAH